jgi:hypothetical protein
MIRIERREADEWILLSTVSEIFSSKTGDTCYYAYDLGDHWYHRLTVEEVIEAPTPATTEEKEGETFGKCVVPAEEPCVVPMKTEKVATSIRRRS